MSLIVLLTDFGLQDGFVGTMKGVIAGIAPAVPVVDLSHDIPPQNIAAAGFVLWNSYRYFPDKTIFVCVVDPGVGSSRSILAVQTDRHVLIAPDNGRDIFSPVAAHLAGGLPFSALGSRMEPPLSAVPFGEIAGKGCAQAKIIYIDHFGNLITDLRFPPGTGGRVVWQGRDIPVVTAYADADIGEVLALGASHGLLEVAIRNGHAAQLLRAGYGDVLTWWAD
jgi:S-adenosyl-L-methionine hydrolase (adenosine-forming)